MKKTETISILHASMIIITVVGNTRSRNHYSNIASNCSTGFVDFCVVLRDFVTSLDSTHFFHHEGKRTAAPFALAKATFRTYICLFHYPDHPYRNVFLVCHDYSGRYLLD